MKIKHILYLPLDERPCNYELPYLLSKIAKDFHLIRPNKNILGSMKKSSSFSKIKSFLLENIEKSDILIISLDQLLYGGIVPSRIHHLNVNTLMNRLSLLKTLKEKNPKVKLYLFSLILRCPCYSTSEEEPIYYGKCGEEIFNYGVLLSKFRCNIISEDIFENESKPLKKKIGKQLTDFETRRKINRHLIECFIEKYSSLCDLIVIPQDDSEPYGYAAIDREYIKNILKKNDVAALMYPGADELGMVLLARAISDNMNFHPSIKAIYPQEICKKVIPMYEAQPVSETLLQQLSAAGFRYDENSNNVIYMNYPTSKCVNMGSPVNQGYIDRNMPSFINKIVNDISNNKKAIICDGAFCNGGEELFLKNITDKISLYKIYGYAGWNTSSNSMGTALANGMLAILYGLNDAHKAFISERVIEDIGYCGHVRWNIWHNFAPEHGYSLENAGCKNGIIAKEIKKQLNTYIKDWFKEIYDNFYIKKCQLPWKRLFEIDLTLRKKI